MYSTWSFAFGSHIAISSISVTLAWFAYSGLAKVTTEIDIKSWLIEFEKNEIITTYIVNRNMIFIVLER